MKIKSGVYMILNIINNKPYIGSSHKTSERGRIHFTELKKNKHTNRHLQNAVNKHGIDNFKFIELEEVELDKLLEREKYWILLKDAINNGYNMYMPTDVWIVKKSIEIVVLSKDTGEFIREFKGITEASLELKIPENRIQDVVYETRKAYKGYIFIKKSDYDSTKDYSIKRPTKYKIPEDRVYKPIKPYIKKILDRTVIQTNVVTGEEVKFISPKVTAEQLSIKLSTIHKLISKEKNSLYGFSYKYETERLSFITI